MGFDVRQVQVPRSRWPELVGALRVDLDAVTDRVAERIADLPSCRAVPAGELRLDVHACLALLTTGLLEPTDPAHSSAHTSAHTSAHSSAHSPGHAPGRAAELHLETFTRIGARRASQGVTATDLFLGWRFMGEEMLAHARRHLSGGVVADGLLLQLVESLTAQRDVAMAASADGHRAVEAERGRRDNHYRATLVRRLLMGSNTPAQMQALLDRFGVDPAGSFHAVRARTAGADLAGVESYLTSATGHGRGRGVVALLDADVCGFVPCLPTEPAQVPVGVSGPVPLADLPAAFRRATRLLDAAMALGRSGLVDMPALGIEAAVVTDDDVGEAMLDRYVRPLAAQGAAGELILDTVSRFLGNDTRLDTTARELHVHVNTVRYRLGRFEQVTGCSLRSNDTLVEVWWALRRRAVRRPA